MFRKKEPQKGATAEELLQQIAESESIKTKENETVIAITEDDGLVKKSGIPKWRYISIAVLSGAFLLFQLYMALIRPIISIISVPTHLCIALIILILYNPLAVKLKNRLWWIIDGVMIITLIIIIAYVFRDVNRLVYRIRSVDEMTPIDLFAAYTMLFIILEIVRRTMGLNLFIFILFFIAYAFFGQYLTGIMRYSGITWQRFGEMLTLSPEGIFGTPLITSVHTLFYFLVFGAFFATTGGGQVLIDLGMKLSNMTVGGPAKAAVISSSLMGMISGSAVANVTATGVFTIPLMKKAGYTPEEAGAVESVASTGGQLMPPIMGVGAFIMAEMLGISYTKVATSAILPALVYYLAIFMVVHFVAKRKALGVKTVELKYTSTPILPRLYHLLPIILVVVMIFRGFSLTISALCGTALAVIINMISKSIRLKPKQLLDTLMDGIKQASMIALPTAACGIMIGIVVRSGVANKLTRIIAMVGGSNIAVALIIGMCGCLLLGMALPTVAAYLISNILFVPTIIAMGIPPFSANMFVFYFGVIAQITPPVCLASFTAAGIAGANSWKTGWIAFAYAIVSFLVPYVFVFSPSILLEGTVSETIITMLVLCTGVVFLACAVAGYCFEKLNVWMRIVLAIAALGTIIPETISTIGGILIGIAMVVLCFFLSRRSGSQVKTT